MVAENKNKKEIGLQENVAGTEVITAPSHQIVTKSLEQILLEC